MCALPAYYGHKHYNEAYPAKRLPFTNRSCVYEQQAKTKEAGPERRFYSATGERDWQSNLVNTQGSTLDGRAEDIHFARAWGGDMARNMSSYGLYHPHQGNIFGGLDDSLLARAEALAAADMGKGTSPPLIKPDSIYGHTDMSPHNTGNPRGQMGPIHGFGGPGDSMLDQISVAGMSMPMISGGPGDHSGVNMTGTHTHSHQMYSPVYTHPSMTNGMSMTTMSMNGHHGMAPVHPHHGPHPMHQHGHPDTECDPRELEAFAEHFKQRRIKLGVTQADVGGALGKLKLPGVGSLSQSTICRFESLTLSHNNMIALKPILQAWLEEAEKVAKDAKNTELLNAADKKRKRTSIAAPEKRSLEAYFAVQPRPSGEKIAQIAEKLELKKNVVRVWFCNQRQKQKRMKFSAQMQGGLGGPGPH